MVVKKASDEGEPFVMMRAEDRSTWMRIAYILEKYKIIVWAVGGAIIMAGFDFKTPKAAFRELHERVDSTQAMVAQDREVSKSLNDKLDALIRMRCVEMLGRENGVRDLQLAGINCAQWLKEP